jgi:transcriptional regulator with PAS, ATPase and Fis domain
MTATFIITSPSAQFTEMTRSVSEELDFPCIIIESILEEAVNRIQELSATLDIAAVISRGGTANMIREKIKIPVLEAKANDFDVLSSLMEARNISRKIAYVQYSGEAIEELERISSLLDINVEQYFFTIDMDMTDAITQAQRDGNAVIVSGSDRAREKCEGLGLPCIVVNTSRRTMEEILRRASLIREVRDREIEYRKQLQTAFDLVPESIFYLDADDNVTLVNRPGISVLELTSEAAILGRPITSFITNSILATTIAERQAHSGLVLDVLGTTVILRTSPVFISDRYLGAVLSLQRASEIEKSEHKVRRQVFTSGMVAKTSFGELESTARSSAMRQCLERATRYAKTHNTILIMGESGTGKELLAQSIHNASPRRRQPFVAINCAALPLSLLESELFGYDEGAFTGAKRGGKPGYFELAHSGTIFLDELGLLPLHVQMQLLRVLQEKQVLRVGGRKMIPVDVRVIAATNADLAAAVADGSFRQDLYYRINVLHVAIPPLRQRQEDIPLLVAHYLALLSHENRKTISSCSDELMRILKQHYWPGNVRELVNYMMRLVVCSQGPLLTIEDLEKSDIRLTHSKENTIETKPIEDNSLIQIQPGTMDNMEQEIIRWHVRHYNGNRAKICDALQISRTTLWKKLKQVSSN